MSRKKKEILEQDSTLRLIYAFNFFIANNETWQIDSSVTEKNRTISKQLGYDLDDAYFVFNNRFYSFNYSRKDDDTINCEIKEYNNNYELADVIIVLSFNYNVSAQEIENVSEKKVVVSETVVVKQPQKMIK